MFRYIRRQWRKGTIKLYLAIMLVCFIAAGVLNVAVDWGSGVIEDMDRIRALKLDPSKMDELKKAYREKMDVNNQENADRDHKGKMDSAEFEKLKEALRGKIDASDLEKLKEAYKRKKGILDIGKIKDNGRARREETAEIKALKEKLREAYRTGK